jgi:hypothetical protein
MTATLALPSAERRILAEAVVQLEQTNFIARLAQYAGTPVDAAIKYLPGSVSRPIKNLVKSAMFRCLDVAINSLEAGEAPAPDWAGKLMTGVTGGIGGFFGLYALPIELPLTTTLMLRTIAEIAQQEGEDMAALEPRLACLEVFALGGGRPQLGGRSREQLSLEYYGVRTMLGSVTRDLGRQMMERGAMHASSPIMARLIGEIVARFGITISDRMGASIVPVIGALGGATVNMIFMDHFQRVARGHFTVRRLERAYGAPTIRRYYEAAADAVAGRPAKAQ